MSNPYDPGTPSGSNPYGGAPGGGNPYGAPGGGNPYGGAPGRAPGGGGYGSTYGQSGAYGDALPKKTDAVSIVAFVLSLTCCLSIVGAVLGFVGLSRTSGGKRKGRWAAITAIPVGLLLTVVAVVAGIALGSYIGSYVDVDEAEAGICVDVEEDDGSVALREKKCSESHDAEIVYVGDAGADAGALELAGAASICLQRIQAEDPELATAISGSDYLVQAIVDDPDDVGSNDRFVCYAEPTVGDLDAPIVP